MYSYAFQCVFRYQAETWHKGRGWSPKAKFVGIFLKPLHQRGKVIQRSSCFRNALWPLSWAERASGGGHRCLKEYLGCPKNLVEISENQAGVLKFWFLFLYLCLHLELTRPYFWEGNLTQCVSLLSRKALWSDLNFFGPGLDAGVWTGNQVHISAGTGDRIRDSLVQSEGRYAALTCLCHVHDDDEIII